MLSVHTQADITVQRLLQSDPHLRDAHIFHAIAHLVDRSEIPHLERIEGWPGFEKNAPG